MLYGDMSTMTARCFSTEIYNKFCWSPLLLPVPCPQLPSQTELSMVKRPKQMTQELCRKQWEIVLGRCLLIRHEGAGV